MYQYTWDTETGGLLLLSDQSQFSKEPRPVYYRELNILGFSDYWNYPQDDSAPIMWAEANNYIYRGKIIARTKGGSVCTKPELIVLEPPGEGENFLSFVDVDEMCKRNQDLMETLVQETIQKIFNTYIEYKNKIDVFYLAFSGGKDSVIALDLVQRALPHDEFKVLFGDTQMEFSDTYDLIEKIKSDCEKTGIEFLVSKSTLSPDITWHEFGPPAQRIRWCCSVHKTSPQILLLRKITNKPSFRGMAFTGIRGDESTSRSQYDEISFGEKHKGQYSFHPILDWSSAEVFLHIFANNLRLNETYKKGNSRAGCLVCPMAALKNFYFKEVSYSESAVSDDLTTTKYNNIILSTSSKSLSTKQEITNFMDTCGWKARRSGRELNFSQDYCLEALENGWLTITLLRERTNWREWIKTLGDIVSMDEDHVEIIYDGKKHYIYHEYFKDKQIFKVDVSDNTKNDILFASALKIVLRKTAYCICCQVCEANCPHGFITMKDGNVTVSDKCIKCRKCHDVFHGCLVANSIKLPKEVKKMGSVDRYGNIGIEYQWVLDYFEKQDEYWDNNDLGPNKIKNLKSFLADAEVIVPRKNTITHLGKRVAEIGIDTISAWGILVSNLVYTSEFNWWVMNTVPGMSYTPIELTAKLEKDVSSKDSRNHIVSAFKNIFASNDIVGNEFGLGICELKEGSSKRVLIDISRSYWDDPIPEVILYSLFKFAEACDGYYQFSLKTLMDDTIDREGISPTRIFGLSYDTMIKVLNGLSMNYPDYISASFSLDLDSINLREDKSANDVLALFR